MFIVIGASTWWLNNMTYNQIVTIYNKEVNQAAFAFGLPPSLIYAIIKTESGGNFLTVGSTNDFGLMQITKPALLDYNRLTGSSVSMLQLWTEPNTNIHVGSWYLSHMFQIFDNTEKAISAYNQGIGNVRNNTYNKDYFNKVIINQQLFIKELTQ